MPDKKAEAEGTKPPVPESWFCRNPDEEPHGPFNIPQLTRRTLDGQITAQTDISKDGEEWMSASSLPDLKLEWRGELEDGTDVGPFNLHTVPDLVNNGTLPRETELHNPFSGETVTAGEAMLHESIKRQDKSPAPRRLLSDDHDAQSDYESASFSTTPAHSTYMPPVEVTPSYSTPATTASAPGPRREEELQHQLRLMQQELDIARTDKQRAESELDVQTRINEDLRAARQDDHQLSNAQLLQAQEDADQLRIEMGMMQHEHDEAITRFKELSANTVDQQRQLAEAVEQRAAWEHYAKQQTDQLQQLQRMQEEFAAREHALMQQTSMERQQLESRQHEMQAEVDTLSSMLGETRSRLEVSERERLEFEQLAQQAPEDPQLQESLTRLQNEHGRLSLQLEHSRQENDLRATELLQSQKQEHAWREHSDTLQNELELHKTALAEAQENLHNVHAESDHGSIDELERLSTELQSTHENLNAMRAEYQQQVTQYTQLEEAARNREMGYRNRIDELDRKLSEERRGRLQADAAHKNIEADEQASARIAQLEQALAESVAEAETAHREARDRNQPAPSNNEAIAAVQNELASVRAELDSTRHQLESARKAHGSDQADKLRFRTDELQALVESLKQQLSESGVREDALNKSIADFQASRESDMQQFQQEEKLLRVELKSLERRLADKRLDDANKSLLKQPAFRSILIILGFVLAFIMGWLASPSGGGSTTTVEQQEPPPHGNTPPISTNSPPVGSVPDEPDPFDERPPQNEELTQTNMVDIIQEVLGHTAPTPDLQDVPDRELETESAETPWVEHEDLPLPDIEGSIAGRTDDGMLYIFNAPLFQQGLILNDKAAKVLHDAALKLKPLHEHYAIHLLGHGYDEGPEAADPDSWSALAFSRSVRILEFFRDEYTIQQSSMKPKAADINHPPYPGEDARSDTRNRTVTLLLKPLEHVP